MRCSPWLTASDADKNAEQLGAFAVYLWKYGMNRRHIGNTYSTICTKLCTVRWFHRNTAGYDPDVNASHAILQRGIRRFTDPVVKQQPLTARLLRRVFKGLNFTQPRDQLLWGGLLLGYFFLLRRSEYLFIGKKVHSYVLRLSAIKFLDGNEQVVAPNIAQVVGITLNGAKNNQFVWPRGGEVSLQVGRQTHLPSESCPMGAQGSSGIRHRSGRASLIAQAGGYFVRRHIRDNQESCVNKWSRSSAILNTFGSYWRSNHTAQRWSRPPGHQAHGPLAVECL